MNWEPAVAMALNTVVIVIHVLVLTLLVVLKQNSVKGSQKLSLISTIYHGIYSNRSIFRNLFKYTYYLFCSSKKTKKVLLVGSVICVSLCLPFVITELYMIHYTKDTFYVYVCPILELIFRIVTFCAYCCIIKRVLKYRRNARKLERQLATDNRIVYHKHSNNLFKLILPTLTH